MNPEYECLLKQFSVDELEAMLAEIELRLGTPGEKPDDFACCRAIGHQINNKLTGTLLSQELLKFQLNRPKS